MGLESQGLGVLAALALSQSVAKPARPRVTPSNGSGVGAIFITPAAISDKLRSVNVQVHALDAEIRTNVTRAAFLSTWSEFLSNWQKFFDEHQSTARILFTGTGTLDRKADEYQAQLGSWYQALQRENPQARLNFPAPLPATKPIESGVFPWWGISLLTLAGVGLAGYGIYSTYKMVKEAQEIKGFLRKEVVPLALREASPDSYTRIHHLLPKRDPSYDEPSPYTTSPWERKHPRHDLPYVPDPSEGFRESASLYEEEEVR